MIHSGRQTPHPFSALSFDQQRSHLRSVAQQALALWGYPSDATVELLNLTENATYRVEAPGLPRVALRVHRLDYASRESIRTELDWLCFLRESTGLRVAEPKPAMDGSYVHTIVTPQLSEERHVVCFAFAGGRPPKDSQDDTEEVGRLVKAVSWIPRALTVPLFSWAAVLYDALAGSSPKSTLTEDDRGLYRSLGRIAGSLHGQGNRWSPPLPSRRIEWDWEATFGTGWNNYYGRHYWEMKDYLSVADIRTLDRCARVMRARTEAFGRAPERYGMIHSDLRLANLLTDGDQMTVLDFDDCGRGWFLYDLACILGFQEHRPDLRQVLDVIVEGYREVRPLSVQERKELFTFVMMRRIGLLQALHYHLDKTKAGAGESAELTPEILAFYAKGTVLLARKYLAEFEELPLPVGVPPGWPNAAEGVPA